MILSARRILEAAGRGAAILFLSLGMLLAGCRAGETGPADPPASTPGAPVAGSTATVDTPPPGASPEESRTPEDSKMPIEGAEAPLPSPGPACAVTKPVWAKPPEDAAVLDPPAHSYYFVNEDGSMWASAWGAGQGEYPFRASEEGIKMGWFRPAGARLEITGRRLDAPAPPLEAHASCCYPTRFQASGVYFPTQGCWEVTAKAADSQLSFIIWVQP